MANRVYNIRSELSELLPRYRIIRDVIEQKVDQCGETYLPCPSGVPFLQRTDVEKQRYTDYTKRAIFYNYVTRTLTGFIGQIFGRDPAIEIPDKLKVVNDDANGDGLSITQIAKDACSEVLSVGRYALLVDYPTQDSRPTQAQIDSGEIRPVIIPYYAEQVIDWDFTKRGAKWVLSWVVIVEDYNYRDPETYQLEVRQQWRELSLDADGNYKVRIFREEDDYGDRDASPRAASKALKEIPFTFIGAVNNDATPDMPPMYDMAQINIGHYRNSADYEESVFIIGQPTFVVTGLTQKWWESVLNKVLKFGSRNGIHLPENSDAKIVQAEPNTMAKEAMNDKQEQLAAMGAEFLRDQSVAKTATEASINDSSRTSAISNAAANVSAGIKFALEWCSIFQGIENKEIDFKLNSQFDLVRMTENERAELVKEWQAGAISYTEMRSALRKAGIATEDDETVLAEVEQAKAAELEAAAKQFANAGGDE